MTRPSDPDQFRQGNGFWYVAREILVNAEDEPLVADALRQFRAERVNIDSELSRHVVLYRLPSEEPSVPEVVERLRSLPTEREPRVGPNHVLAAVNLGGQPNYHGGGQGGAPIVADKLPTAGTSNADPVIVAIIDTGVDPNARTYPLLNGRFAPANFEPDPVYEPSGPPAVALMGGHGTMAAGIIARHAPNAVLLSVQVLEPDGVGTETCVADGVLRAVARGATVLNLSLGGYVQPGQPPTALDWVLTNLDNRVSVVAAAGNYGQNAPFYPAAHQRVVGVAALDTTFPAANPAGFSNYGPWVKTVSPGVRIHSTYVTGIWAHDGVPRTFHGYASWSGTSFAGPHVAAVIADAVQGGGTARAAEFALLKGLPKDPDYGLRVAPPNVVIF